MFKIQKARIAVVIGKNGQTKEEIEKKLGVKIDLNSKTGDCEVIPSLNDANYNPLNVLTAQKIISAINRGFNPQKAMLLLDEDHDLEIFNLMIILGKSENRIKRIKGRIIGRNGEMRKSIERYSECLISVYGKNVAIIGNYENLQVGRKAISMLINGMPHHTVLKYLDNKYNEKKKEEFKQLYKPEF
ncbi:MAG: KH domain-containing protein [Promethearchaeota archaeon]